MPSKMHITDATTEADKLKSQCFYLPTQYRCRCNYALLIQLLNKGYFRKMDIQEWLPKIGFTVVENPKAAFPGENKVLS